MDAEAQSDGINELLGGVQGHIQEVEHLFDEATVKAIINKANPQSAAGPSGLRYSHLEAALCDELVKEIAEFATLVFSSRISTRNLLDSAHERQYVRVGTKGEAGRVRRRSPKGYWRRFLP